MAAIKIIDKFAGRFCKITGKPEYGIYLGEVEGSCGYYASIKLFTGETKQVDVAYFSVLSDEDVKKCTAIPQVHDVGYAFTDKVVDIHKFLIVESVDLDTMTLTAGCAVTDQKEVVKMSNFKVVSRPTLQQEIPS